ncbi:GlxA family transcriptional regulator [Chitinophaga arvensicola]|uniref:Transcriptional regulator GlxA family, contains an amidase domain and an AraC-type DNA-binding HTH domain n=1 Tax=Chitinophaga arvensicola TaxID=29529 RepID=A0A1I0RE14_9BACT|nr:helix-turn-helix domain-containing protein [Chitinophaga arvensicola]SEW39100.1 Transcriptional regulator GlxA family, contains an amidase domain and an AraC-type DNA-binding HTH domain [Chitinophaga arvensicola]
MKQISILVPKGAVALSCIEGSFVCFTKANDFLESLGRPPLFNVQLVGLSKEAQEYDRFFKVTPDVLITDKHKADLIIIPAVNGEREEMIEQNKDFFPWIVKQHHAGSEVASLCVGSFLLASTGLLNGKRCSTHWLAANEFRNMFPDIELVSEKIITDEKGIYSSGGANSFWNLLIYILEKYTDRDLAILASKYFEIEIDRTNQSTFTIFKGQREHQDESVKQAQEFIEQNWQDKITVEQLSSMFAVGRRSLERRFKKATSNTVSEYIQRVKVEVAKKSFESSRKNINEIMWEVGYSDTKAFRTIFKKTTGLSPLEYRNKYNKGAVKI